MSSHSYKEKKKKKPTLHSQLKQEAYEKDLQTKMMYAKIDFERNLLSSYQSSKTNRIFKYIHKITGHRAIPTTITYKSSQASEDTAKASLFNRYFQSVFTQSSFKLPLALPPPEVSISDITIVETDVYKALISLDPDKAMGIDGIGPKILKYCSLSLYIQTTPPFILAVLIPALYPRTVEDSSYYSHSQIW